MIKVTTKKTRIADTKLKQISPALCQFFRWYLEGGQAQNLKSPHLFMKIQFTHFGVTATKPGCAPGRAVETPGRRKSDKDD